jgi:hypothetical protein
MRTLLAHATRVSIVGALLISTVAHAADKPPKKALDAAPKAQKFDFDEDVVDGALMTPEGAVVDRLRPIKHDTLIKVRTSFVAEILKSAEDY